MCSCEHKSVCKYNSYFPSTFCDDGLRQGMTGDTKLPLYIRNRWCFAGWRELFLVRVGERPKALLLGKGCMSCAWMFLVQGGVRPNTSLLGRSEALLGSTRLSPSNGKGLHLHA